MSTSKLPVFRSPVEAMYDHGAISAATGTVNTEPSKCREEFAEECDINVLLRRFGAVPPTLRQPMYGEQDFTLELRDHLDAVRAATEAWALVPRAVRERYKDWSALLMAVDDGHVKFGESPEAIAKAKAEAEAAGKPRRVVVVEDPESSPDKGSKRKEAP